MKQYLLSNDAFSWGLLTGAPRAAFSLRPQRLDRQRQATWKRFVEHSQKKKKPLIVMIGGASNTGKSTWGIEIAYRLGIRNIVHTDTLRNTLRATLERRKHPALFLSSYQCWRPYAKTYNPAALARGFHDQSKLVAKAIRAVVQDAEDYGKFTLIEGMHVTPSLLDSLKGKHSYTQVFLLDVSREETLRKRLEDRCESTYLNRSASKYSGVFPEFKTLRERLVRDAKKKSVPVVSNETHEQTLAEIMKHLFDGLDRILKKS